MKRRDLIIGLIVLVLAVGAYFYGQKLRNQNQPKVPQTLSSEDNTLQNIENKFNVKIPDNVQKATLKDVSGGNGQGLATRNFTNGQFSFDILADLPDPQTGYFYQGFIVKGQEGTQDYSAVSVGQLTVAKGGWLIHYQSSTDYSNHNEVVVSLQNALSNTPENPVLRGSF